MKRKLFRNPKEIAFRLLALVFGLFLAFPAPAATPLDTWREEISAVQAQSENDAPLAYKHAQRLQKALPADATPADRARALNLLARIEIYLALTEQADEHVRQAMDLARKSGDKVGQAQADLNVALNSVNEANIDNLVAAATHSMAVLDGVDRPDLLAEAMLRTAMMYRRTGQFDESVTMAMQAMDIARRSNNSRALAYAQQGLGISYDQSGRHAEALNHYSQMLEQARILHSKIVEADALLGIASQMSALGDLREGESRIREAIAIYRSVGGPFYLAHGLYELASNLRMQKRYAQALPILDEVAATYRRYPNKIGLWWTLNTRCEVQQSLGHALAARADAEQAYTLARDIGLALYMSNSARRLAAIVAASGDTRRAYELSVEAASMADKASREKSSARMIELAQRYQVESKQRQIEELNRRNEKQAVEIGRRALQQRWLWTVLSGSIAILLGSAYFMLRLRRSQGEIRALNADLERRVHERTDELRQQSRYLRTLLDTLPVSVWLKDAESRYLVVNAGNRAGKPFFEGENSETMVGKTDEELWPNDIGLSFRDSDLEVMETRRRKTVEISIPAKDGTLLWREIDKAAVIDEDGTVIGTVGVARDITERKQMQEALNKRERELRALAESSPGMMGSFYRHPDGRVSMPYVSPNIFDLFGLNPHDVAEDASSLMAMNHPDDIQTVQDSIAESARTMTTWHAEFRILHPTKGERWMEGNTNPEHHPDGGVIWYGYVHDITGRKRMEERLRASEQDFRTLAENLPDNLTRFDREGRRTYVNPALTRNFGIPPEQLLGKTLREANPANILMVENYQRALEHTLTTGERSEFEVRIPLPSGEMRTHLFFIVSERAEDGRISGAIAISRDISELKRYEAAREAALDEAVRLAKLRSEFLAHMSHELRTPLNGILGYAQIMQRDKTLEGRNAAALNIISQCGEHLLALIEDILDLARIENGRLELVSSDIPLLKFLHIVAEIVDVRARQKGLEFSCELAADLPDGICGDERRLRQVLLNLLSNAVKFTDRGRVALRVNRAGPSRIAFAVEDSGIGIEAEKLEAIFRSFEQAGDARHRQGGTGLGLAISRQLVRRMGGDIAVESRAGEGSIFRFELELPEVDVVSASLLTSQIVTGYAGARRKVLIADDEASNRAVLADLLAPLGFGIVTACDGREALELAQSTRPDLVLMDIVMPRMGGVEAIRHLRRTTGLAPVPIIALSAGASGGDDAQSLEAGANAFLSKPIDQGRLLAQMAQLLQLDLTTLPPAGVMPPPGELAGLLIAPPAAEMQELHRLARLGSMRDILRFTEYIAGLDARYQEFAARLRQLANAYQSKAVLAFIEEHLI